MRLYNNDPAVPTGDSDNEEYDVFASYFSQLKDHKFLLRDLYTFGCPRLGGVIDDKDWAAQFNSALSYHTGESWRVVNEYDPVAAIPPVVPYISTWNHVDNGYQVSDMSLPEALPTEDGTQPDCSFKPWNYPYHCELASYWWNE